MTEYALTIEQEIPDPTLVLKTGQGLQCGLTPITPGTNQGPLARTKWIDGNTAVPADEQTGTEGSPYSSPAAWLGSLNAEPLSLDDASTLEVGLISPAATDDWNPNPQTWVIPAGRCIAISNLTASGIAAVPGAFATAPQGAAFAGTTITWTNTAATFEPPYSTLTLNDLSMTNMALALTDAGQPSALVLSGFSGYYQGTLNFSAASSFAFLSVLNTTCNLNVTNGGGGATYTLKLNTSTWTSTLSLQAGVVVAIESSLTLSSNLTTSGSAGQSYSKCSISCLGTMTATLGAISFKLCTFSQATTLTAASGGVVFDGPSWASFQAAGGVITAGTVVKVTGGYLSGEVLNGTPIHNPAGNAVTLSINGSGATTGFTTGGNSYQVTSLAATSTITLVDGGGAVNGTSLLITSTDTSGHTLNVADAASGTIASITAIGFFLLTFNGSTWVLKMIS